MRSRRSGPSPTRRPRTMIGGSCFSSSEVMPEMLRHQQELLGQIGNSRMLAMGSQRCPKVADALDAGRVLDLAQDLERVGAELAGPIHLAGVGVDGSLVGQVAGALLGRLSR